MLILLWHVGVGPRLVVIVFRALRLSIGNRCLRVRVCNRLASWQVVRDRLSGIVPLIVVPRYLVRRNLLEACVRLMVWVLTCLGLMPIIGALVGSRLSRATT